MSVPTNADLWIGAISVKLLGELDGDQFVEFVSGPMYCIANNVPNYGTVCAVLSECEMVSMYVYFRENRENVKGFHLLMKYVIERDQLGEKIILPRETHNLVLQLMKRVDSQEKEVTKLEEIIVYLSERIRDLELSSNLDIAEI